MYIILYIPFVNKLSSLKLRFVNLVYIYIFMYLYIYIRIKTLLCSYLTMSDYIVSLSTCRGRSILKMLVSSTISAFTMLLKIKITENIYYFCVNKLIPQFKFLRNLKNQFEHEQNRAANKERRFFIHAQTKTDRTSFEFISCDLYAIVN